MSEAIPVAILAALILLAFGGMAWGWRHRRAKHSLPPLLQPTKSGPVAIGGNGRYFGTTVAGDWLDRVVARGLGSRSDCTLVLDTDGLIVTRPGQGAFLIPREALVGVRRDRGLAGKVIPPAGMLVITWQHGDLTLDSGFRLDDGRHDRWITEVDKIVKEHSS